MDAMFSAVYYALNLCDKMQGCSGTNHTPCLQRKILEYFSGVENADFCKKIDGQSRFFLISELGSVLENKINL